MSFIFHFREIGLLLDKNVILLGSSFIWLFSATLMTHFSFLNIYWPSKYWPCIFPPITLKRNKILISVIHTVFIFFSLLFVNPDSFPVCFPPSSNLRVISLILFLLKEHGSGNLHTFIILNLPISYFLLCLFSSQVFEYITTINNPILFIMFADWLTHFVTVFSMLLCSLSPLLIY